MICRINSCVITKHDQFRFLQKLFLAFILSMSVLPLRPHHADAGDALIEIVEAAWTNGVKDQQPVIEYTKRTSSRPLYLWMRVKGERQALEVLRKEGKLPIRHKWFKLVGVNERWDGNPELKDDINLSVGMEDKLDKLELELSEQKFFDWRIWSMKENLRSGFWLVRMVYADDEPVKCGIHDCQWSIEIR